MNTGRRPSDCAMPAEDRGGADRRAADRRAPFRRFDPLFAASLVNQIAPAETAFIQGYQPAPTLARRGLMVNLRA